MNETIEREWTTKQFAQYLGLKRYQLNYLIDGCVIPDAERRVAGRRVWSEQEVKGAEQILNRRKAEKRSRKGNNHGIM